MSTQTFELKEKLVLKIYPSYVFATIKTFDMSSTVYVLDNHTYIFSLYCFQKFESYMERTFPAWVNKLVYALVKFLVLKFADWIINRGGWVSNMHLIVFGYVYCDGCV